MVYRMLMMVMLMMLMMMFIVLVSLVLVVASPGAVKPPPSHPQFDEPIASPLKGGDGSGCAP